MFQSSNLAKLYPHLNFNRVAPPSRSVSVPPKDLITSERIDTSVPIEPAPLKVTQAPDITQTKEVVVEQVTVPDPPKRSHKKKIVAITEPIVDPIKISEPVITLETVPPKHKRPNRVKVEPKPEPDRESQIPQKGERGLQLKYTLEQRKQIYMDRLSRKSIKNAEKEVELINQVLNKVDNDPIKLLEKEKHIKRKLQLINYAKFFSVAPVNNDVNNVNVSSTNIINNAKEPETASSVSLLNKSEGSTVPIDGGQQESTTRSRRRRSRSRSERSPSNEHSKRKSTHHRKRSSSASSGSRAESSRESD